MKIWQNQDLSDVPIEELTRIIGILKCDRMIFTKGPDGDAETDAKIVKIAAEIAKRHHVDFQRRAAEI